MSRHMSHCTTYEWLKAEYLEIFGPLCDVDWTPLADIDSSEYSSAMMKFSDLLAEAGWSWPTAGLETLCSTSPTRPGTRARRGAV